MLTKNDLTQIRKLMREEIGNESEAIRDDITGEVKMAMIRTVTEVRELKDRVKNLEIRLTKIHKDLKNEIKLVREFFNQDVTQMCKRINKIESQVRATAN